VTLLWSILTMQCEMKKVATMNHEYGSLAKDGKALFVSQEDSDVTFRLDDGSILQAHALILKMRSPFLKNLLSLQGTSNDLIPITGVTKDAFRVLLEYLYTDQIAPHPDAMAVIHVANRFECESLKTLIEKSLVMTLSQDNCAEGICSSPSHLSCPLLLEASMNKVVQHLGVLTDKHSNWKEVESDPQLLTSLLKVAAAAAK